jgi:hypothetical protein
MSRWVFHAWGYEVQTTIKIQINVTKNRTYFGTETFQNDVHQLCTKHSLDRSKAKPRNIEPSVKKQSYPRAKPWRPTALRDVQDPTLCRQSAHRWRWSCKPYPPVTLYFPESCCVLATHFCQWLSKPQGFVRPKGPATFRLVVQCLRHYAVPCPNTDPYKVKQEKALRKEHTFF